jgi:uncharacterized protein
MTKGTVTHRKHVPLRTCIACRQNRGKRELVRVVRTPDSGVKIDPTGKMAGRGAYLCRARTCWSQALSGHRLDAALKTTIVAEDRAALEAFAASLPETLAAIPEMQTSQTQAPKTNTSGKTRTPATPKSQTRVPGA